MLLFVFGIIINGDIYLVGLCDIFLMMFLVNSLFNFLLILVFNLNGSFCMGCVIGVILFFICNFS